MPGKKQQRQQQGPGKARSTRSLRRSGPTKSRRNTLLIVCEGTKTECSYFEAMRRDYRLSNVDVVVTGVGGAPITVVETAITRKAKADVRFDEVWCVFDTEVPQNPSLQRALDKARAKKLSLAVSNPSFEFWYLLHFAFTTRSFHDADEVIQELQRHISGYTKATACYFLLADKMDTAIEHAKRIAVSETDPYPHPSTTVYGVVEALRALTRQ